MKHWNSAVLDIFVLINNQYYGRLSEFVDSCQPQSRTPLMVKVQCIRANCKLQIKPTSGCRKVKFIEEEDWCRKVKKTVGFVVGNISCGKVKKENKAFFAGQVSRWADRQHAKARSWWFIKSNWQNQDKGRENPTKNKQNDGTRR